jgi:hypothetical protein
MTGAATGRAMSALGASTSRADPALRALTSPRVGPRHGVVARPERWRVPRASSGDASFPTGDGDAGNADGTNEAYTRVSDAELRLAIQECRELLEEATRMAGEQARAELAASFLRTPEGTEGGLTGNLAVDMARVQLFFQGKGMRPWEAENTSRTLVELDSIYEDVELLAVKFDRLQRTLPDVDVKAMVAADPNVMTVELAGAVDRMLDLFAVFGPDKGRRVLAEAPRLLYCEEGIREKIAKTSACIKRVYPRETDESCVYALGEEPNLLFDLPDLKIFKEENRKGIDIAELPMQVQECLVYATRQEHE